MRKRIYKTISASALVMGLLSPWPLQVFTPVEAATRPAPCTLRGNAGKII